VNWLALFVGLKPHAPSEKQEQGQLSQVSESRPGAPGKKDALDVIDRATNDRRQIAQRWKDVLAAEGQSVGENYANGRISLIYDLNVSLPGGEVGHVLSRSSPLWNYKNFTTLVFVANVPDPLPLQMWDQQPVLIFNVESVQGPDVIPISSLVGLYNIHDEVDDPFGGLMFESAIDGCFKFILGVVHRKLGVFSSLSSSSKFNIIGDKIERSSEIMQSVSNYAHEFFWHGLTKLELERITSGVRVTFNPNGVKVTLDDFANQKSIQVSDVLFGPLDL